MIQRRRHDHELDEVPEYWITYSDLMVSLLMTFALMLFLALGSVQKSTQEVKGIVDANTEAMRLAGEALQGTGHEIVLDTASGTITMSERVLFDRDSSRLKPEGQDAIRRFAVGRLPRLLKAQSLDAPLQEIAIEGHTDPSGSYLSNLRLSQERAFVVMQAIVAATDSLPEADQIRRVIVASGRSETHPIVVGGKVDAARSRRIEIHIRFKNEALLKRVIESAQFGR